jgi:hypothetical protein
MEMAAAAAAPEDGMEMAAAAAPEVGRGDFHGARDCHAVMMYTPASPP